MCKNGDVHVFAVLDGASPPLHTIKLRLYQICCHGFMLILCDSALPFYSPFSQTSKQHTHIKHYDVEKAHVRKSKDSSLHLFYCLWTDHIIHSDWRLSIASNTRYES